jgi:hypothetical protein
MALGSHSSRHPQKGSGHWPPPCACARSHANTLAPRSVRTRPPSLQFVDAFVVSHKGTVVKGCVGLCSLLTLAGLSTRSFGPGCLSVLLWAVSSVAVLTGPAFEPCRVALLALHPRSARHLVRARGSHSALSSRCIPCVVPTEMIAALCVLLPNMAGSCRLGPRSWPRLQPHPRRQRPNRSPPRPSITRASR